MTDPNIIAGMNRQAELEALKSAFFASGGKIDVLPIFRREENPIPYNGRSKRGGCVIDPAADERAAEQIRALAEKGVGLIGIMKELGIGHPRMKRICENHSITIAATKKVLKPAKPRSKYLAQITALAAQGLTIEKIAERCGCNKRTVIRVIAEFNIVRGKKMDIAKE